MSPEDQAARFVAEARKLLGARWRHRGRQPWAVDCIGLVVLAGRAARLAAEDAPRGYGREPWEDRLREGCRARWGDPVTDWRPGDVALFRWGQGEPSHMGILGNGPRGLTLIHANNHLGVVECSLNGPYLKAVVEVYRPVFLP